MSVTSTATVHYFQKTTMKVTCQSCGKTLTVSNESAGKRVRCPGCKQPIPVPVDGDATAVAKSQRPADSASARTGGGASERPVQKHTQPRRRKDSQSSVEDVWNQPLSSYSSPALEEHEYGQFGLTPPGQKKIIDRDASTTDPSKMLMPSLIIFGIGLLIGCGGIGAALAVPKVGGIIGWVAVVIGGLMGLVANLRLRAMAYEEDTTTGVLYTWIPFYQLYFIFTRFHVTRVPFLVNCLGTVVAILCFVAIAISNLKPVGTGG